MPISDLPSVCADQDTTLIERFRRARRDQTLAVLEGFHAIKHAIRFHAALEQVCAVDPDELRSLVERLAPDIGPELSRLAKAVPRAVFAELAPVPPETGIIAIARRRQADGAAVLAERGTAPVVLLEAPARLGNLGAVVRVAAAAGAAAVLTTGPQDPWHPAALRGSAGLHFALPVARIDRAACGPRSAARRRPSGRRAAALRRSCPSARFWHSARSGAASVPRCSRQRTGRSPFPCARAYPVSAWRARSR